MIIEYLETKLAEIKAEMETIMFADFLRRSREVLRMKQYSLAEIVGISSARLKHLETGHFRKMPTTYEIKALADTFGVSFDVLKQKALEHDYNYFDINDYLSNNNQVGGVMDILCPSNFDHHIVDSIDVRLEHFRKLKEISIKIK